MAKTHKALQARLDAQREALLKRRRGAVRMYNNWLKFAIGFLAIYSLLPILAPTLMKLGITGPANAIYTIYSPTCHQFAFRSTFLFGESTTYPRDVSVAEGATFEDYAVQSEEFQDIYTRRRQESLRRDGLEEAADAYQFAPTDLTSWDEVLQMSAREFKGDDTMGYKIAICQRDIMIYVAMLGSTIIYYFVRHRLRPAPFLLYVWLGIVPIGLDGFSQLFGYPPFTSWGIFEGWDVRETVPFFRYLTGALFGIMNVWFAFPYLESTMSDNVRRIDADIAELEANNTRLSKNLTDKS